ncbi:MAG: hypothetical protein NTZ56_20970 [Acidobacteria bacterium]|nr:hypothetical protein [Acidobacteriota bacterium]
MNKNELSCPMKNSAQPELLLDYVARRLDAARAAALEDHAASCECCQQFMADQALLWQELDLFEPAAISPKFDQSVYARLAADDRSPWWVRTWRKLFAAGEPGAWRPAMALSAACAVVLTAGLIQLPGSMPWRHTAIHGSAAVEQAVAPVADARDVELAEKALEDLEMLQVVSGGKL